VTRLSGGLKECIGRAFSSLIYKSSFVIKKKTKEENNTGIKRRALYSRTSDLGY